MKKLIPFFLITLILLWGSSSVPVHAENHRGTVILVSDNAADLAMAELLSNLTGYPVVTTNWGIYTPGTTAKVLSYSPGEVLVIGGPAAVPEDYIADLQEANVSVVRLWGKDRYATNAAVLGNLTALGISLSGPGIFAPGDDPASISTALRLATQKRARLVYFNGLNSSAPKEGIIVVPAWWRGNYQGEVVKVKVTNWTAKMRINEVQNKLDFLMNVTNASDASTVSRYLTGTRELLREAMEAYKNGDYVKAYELANRAGESLSIAIREIETDPDVKAEIDVAMFEVYYHNMKALSPKEEKELQQLLQQLKTALKNHNYSEARRIRLIIIIKYFQLCEGDLINPAPRPDQVLNP